MKENNIIGTPESLAGKKILVVDDNIMNRMVANIILQEFNVLVFEAADGKDAVNFIKNNQCDLILMDLQMPVMDGYKASETIRKELKLDTPIIALTASDIDEDKEKCFEVGMNDYLYKPFEKEQFLKIICNWLH